MAKEIFYVCDRCGAGHFTDKQILVFTVAVGDQRDLTGETETIRESVDLCPSCAASELRSFLVGMNYQAGKQWANRVKKLKDNFPK